MSPEVAAVLRALPAARRHALPGRPLGSHQLIQLGAVAEVVVGAAGRARRERSSERELRPRPGERGCDVAPGWRQGRSPESRCSQRQRGSTAAAAAQRSVRSGPAVAQRAYTRTRPPTKATAPARLYRYSCGRCQPGPPSRSMLSQKARRRRSAPSSREAAEK